MGNPQTNIEALLEQAKADFVAEVLASVPSLPSADERLNAIRAVAAEQYARDSDKLAALKPLAADTLIGHYFRAPDPQDQNAEAGWLDGAPCRVVEGMIIGQPFTSSSTAIYLVEFYGEHGGSGYQQLVELDRMLMQRWAFYDSAAWLTSQSASGAVAESYAEAMAQEKGGEAA